MCDIKIDCNHLIMSIFLLNSPINLCLCITQYTELGLWQLSAYLNGKSILVFPHVNWKMEAEQTVTPKM